MSLIYVQQAKVEDILRTLEGYTAEDLQEELRTWSPEEILRIWALLEPTYRSRCRRFGLLPPSRRARAYRLHQLIQRLAVLQEVALKTRESAS